MEFFMDDEVFALTGLPPEAVESIQTNNKTPDADVYMRTLLNVLRRVPEAARRMESNGIPDAIIRATFADIGLWAGRCKRQQGFWGLTESSVGWLENHLECKIFRVGRFQCMPRYMSNYANIRLYRHNKTGRVLALPAGDVFFREDGQINGTSGVNAGPNGFQGFFREREVAGRYIAEGTIVSPAGHGENRTISLYMDEWTEVLKEGMPVFELHIPVDGDFRMETCQKTLTDMVSFARNHTKGISRLTNVEGPYTAFVLCSWLLNAQLDGILPRTSNLVRHLRQYYLVPVLCPEENELFWIFDGRKVDIDNLQPEDMQTSLQRGIINFMRDGGKVRYNLGIVMFDDVVEFGNEFYRKRYGMSPADK